MAWARAGATRKERLDLITIWRQRGGTGRPVSLQVTYVTHRLLQATCHLPLHSVPCPSQLTCFLLPSVLPPPLLTPILCSITCTRCSKDGASSVSPRSRGRLWGQRCCSGATAQRPQCQQSPSPATRPHLVGPGAQRRLFLLRRQQYHGVGLALPRVARPAPAGSLGAAEAPLSPTRLFPTARTGGGPQEVPKGGFPGAGSCPRAGLQIRPRPPC